jgi:hypothetical protein
MIDMNQAAEDEFIPYIWYGIVKSVKFLWVIKIYMGIISYQKEPTNAHIYVFPSAFKLTLINSKPG